MGVRLDGVGKGASNPFIGQGNHSLVSWSARANVVFVRPRKGVWKRAEAERLLGDRGMCRTARLRSQTPRHTR